MVITRVEKEKERWSKVGKTGKREKREDKRRGLNKKRDWTRREKEEDLKKKGE